MDLRYTPEETAFRDEVRTFMRTQLPDGIRKKLEEGRSPSKDDIVTWQRILNKKGWAVAPWPKEYGGTGWTPMQQYIFLEEMQQAPAPQPLQFGVNMVGPVIYTFGSAAQKAHFLPRIANLDDWWCQGFPNQAPALTSRRSKLRPNAMATTMSSTARRPGPRSPNMPTGFSAWCAPTRLPRSSRESRSC
jgi:alkylation response protein AidB-like acyl-CoA dehydrogenase